VTETATHGEHRSGEFTTRDGVVLFEQEWTVASPKACVIIVHGFGEHSSRYPHVAERLNADNFSVYTYDQRHHGKSPGAMGDIESFDPLAGDLDEFVALVRTRVPEVPLFLFGHSMGGLVLALYVVRFSPDVRGLVFSSPGVKEDGSIGPLQKFLASVLAKILPKAPVLALDISGLSRIPEVVERYNADPLVYHGKIGARSGLSFMRAIGEVNERMNEIALPLFVQHGSDDRVVPVAAGEVLHAKVSSKDKLLKVYPGAYHEVFNDLGAEEFLDDTADWMKSRL